MSPVRVFIFSEAILARRLIALALQEIPGAEVVGTASTRNAALQRLAQSTPDVVVLCDASSNGETAATRDAVRAMTSELDVIVLDAIAPPGETGPASGLGPRDVTSEIVRRLRDELAPRIASAGVKSKPRAESPITRVATSRPVPIARADDNVRVDVVAIGVSTGGPNALTSVIAALPASFPVPIVIVQHMPPVFTRLLAERMDAQSQLRVSEAVQGAVLERGRVVLAPGDYHMLLRRTGAAITIALNQDPHENSCRPAVDVLFRSVADVYGASTLAVVLTGMGHDGLSGCEILRAAGARILVQDEPSSVVWGMPGYVARAGLADAVLPLERMAGEIVRRVELNRSAVARRSVVAK